MRIFENAADRVFAPQFAVGCRRALGIQLGSQRDETHFAGSEAPEQILDRFQLFGVVRGCQLNPVAVRFDDSFIAAVAPALIAGRIKYNSGEPEWHGSAR